MVVLCWVRAAIASATLTLAPAVSETNTPPAAIDVTNVWSFDIVPYLWVAGYEGTFGVPTVPPDIPPTHSDSAFSTHLSAAAMLAAHIHFHDAGLFLDGAWVQLRTEGESGSSLYSGTDIKSDVAYGTLALTYRLRPKGNLQADLLAGARVWHISNEIEFKPGLAPGFTADNSRTWSDPIVGASLQYDITKEWFCTVLGDVGGFGVGSDISWSIFGGVGCRFATWVSATLGYRYLHVDYNKDDFLMNANIQGFLLGLGFHF
jgi:hypothetical protein